MSWNSWSTVSEEVAAPRGVVTATLHVDWNVPSGAKRLAVFVSDQNGALRATTSQDFLLGPEAWSWGTWVDVAGGRAPPGSPVTIAPWGEWPLAVFFTDTDGRILTTAGGPQRGFPGGWAQVAGGLAQPGSPVTIVPWGEWPFAVFVTGTDGSIYTTAGNPQDGFPGGWAGVGGGLAQPGSLVTAFPRVKDQLVFVTGLDGRIYVTVGNPQDGFRQPWQPLDGIKAPLGSPITATLGAGGLITLFVTDINGGVYTTSGGIEISKVTTWQDWSPVVQPQGTAAPGSPVTVVGGDLLFVTAPNGEVLFTTPAIAKRR